MAPFRRPQNATETPLPLENSALETITGGSCNGKIVEAARIFFVNQNGPDPTGLCRLHGVRRVAC